MLRYLLDTNTISFHVRRSSNALHRPPRRGTLAGIEILPLTSDVAPRCAEIRATLEGRGTPIGPLDTMIAAHALALGVTLVSNDLAEFQRVPGLKVVDWTV